MRIVLLADVKARLGAYVDECGADGPIVITRNGKAVAVLLVPNDDDDLERLLLERSPRFQAMLNRSRQSIKEGEGLSEEDFWKAVRKRAQDERLRPRQTATPSVESRAVAIAHLGDPESGKDERSRLRRWTHGLSPGRPPAPEPGTPNGKGSS